MKDLNNAQRTAAQAKPGPIAIIAGPGTGKTKTLVARIEHLLKTGVHPQDILALTFTRKAAASLRERVGDNSVHITTFHGICFDMLKQAGRSPENVVAEADRHHIIRNVRIPEALRDLTRTEIGLMITRAKNSGDNQPQTKAIRQAIQSYNSALTKRGLHDYDDLLLDAKKLLESDETSHSFKHILVDEFQDTNRVQYDLLQLLSAENSVFVIGDPHQSIYGFRGAHGSIFDHFIHEHPKAMVIELTENYRSAQPIVDVAHALFPESKPLTTQSNRTGSIAAIEALDEHSEARFIINEIEGSIGGTTMLKGSTHMHDADDTTRFSDYGVIYRSRSVARTLQKAFDESGIPYQIAGDGSPYHTAEAKAIIDCLRYFAGGPLPHLPKLRQSQTKTLLDSLRSKHSDASISEQASTLAEKLELINDRNRRKLQQFLNSLTQYSDWSLRRYLAHVDDISAQEFYDPGADAVTLLTIHAAKGLEFKNVFVIAIEEDVLPHKRANDPESLEEERRLLYVAVTRAKQRLVLLHARKRANTPTSISKFIAELPESVLARTVDPAMSAQIASRTRWRHKNSQTSLF